MELYKNGGNDVINSVQDDASKVLSRGSNDIADLIFRLNFVTLAVL